MAERRAPAAEQTPTPVFKVGDVLTATYELKAVLGEGAMGQVFEAQDLRLNRRVAIKVAWPHVGSQAIRHEAQALAAIRHPGLVSVYAASVHDGVEYVVMERLHGVSFAAYLERERERTGQPLPVGRALDLLVSLSDALAAVHQAGLIHRDLKPENVMLAPGDRVVLVDFGLFLPQFDAGPQAKIIGSPLYMAPEALRNKVLPSEGHLVDIYALGCVIFEMLAGEAPFLSDTVREVIERQLRAPAPPLSRYRPDAPPSVCELVGEMLSKAPRERPQSAEQVLWTLRKARERLGTEKRPNAFTVIVASHVPSIAKAVMGHVRGAAPDAEVRHVSDVEKLLGLRDSDIPRLLLLDPTLPDLNPVEVCMVLRGSEAGAHCTFALLGETARPEDRAVFARLGVFRTLPLDEQIDARLLELVLEVRRG